MTSARFPWRRRHRVSRRAFLRSAAAGGAGLAGAYLIACGGGGDSPSPTATAVTTAIAPTPVSNTPGPTTYRWEPLVTSGAAPAPRRDHSLTTDTQHLYVYGGRGPEAMDDVWLYDIATNRWSFIPAVNVPPARFGHNAVWDPIELRLIVFGGEGADGSFLNDVWALSPSTVRWEQLDAGDVVPEARYGAGGVRDRAGRLVITHGFTSFGRFDDTWAYDSDAATWEDSSPAEGRPIERCLVRAVWDTGQNRLLMFGGQTTDTPFLGDFWSLQSGVWTQLEGGPAPRNLYAMGFDETADDLYLYGGNTEAGPAGDAWRYSSDGRWSQLEIEGDAPAPRFGHDASWVLTRNSLYVFGGNDGGDDLNDFWELKATRS